MNATIPPEAAKALGLAVVGDETMVTVLEILPDGSVMVRGEDEVPRPVPPPIDTDEGGPMMPMGTRMPRPLANLPSPSMR